MTLTTLDWSLIVLFFMISLTIGFVVSKRAGKSETEFFLSGRNMPWWLLGMSMVATTFSIDTPTLVTDLVRKNGVAGNWAWWTFLLTGMLTVFVYARLWRKSDVLTDIEFYELRYSGAGARFLRGFRAVYLGLLFNILAMATVCLATIKFGAVVMGFNKYETIVVISLITMLFSSLGGFRGVIYTDFILFFIAIIGAVSAAVVAVNHEEVGGLTALVNNEAIKSKLSLFPDFSNTELMMTIFVIPLAVQWWNAWYPGAEPGGGGYIAQRMLAAKDEDHAIKATFFFNILHYALRPWPWILVALASLIVFPTLDSLQTAFPSVSEDKLGEDVAYAAMLTFLPNGLLGLVMASLIAAFMSTISTHLNWGASYLVHDFYKRFVRPQAGGKELVTAGRILTVFLMIFAALLAFYLTDATQAFNLIIMFGAGTGLIFILRWFWWRINAWSELSAMIVSGIVSIGFNFFDLFPASYLPEWSKFPMVVLLTTIAWITTTFLTRPTHVDTLRSFYKKIQPGGPGWRKIIREAETEGIDLVTDKEGWRVPSGILAMLLGTVLIYSALFATGNWIYQNFNVAVVLTLLAVASALALSRVWKKVGKKML